MPATDVVADANIALKWFRSVGEEDVEPARELLDLHRARTIVVHLLDLTFYEVGNALLRGRARASADQASAVLGALREICLVVVPTEHDFALAAELAVTHDLTLYDAAYAAVAQLRGAPLVTLDRAILAAGLGTRPADLLRQLNEPGR